MKLNKNQQAFFALLKAGLWEKEVQLIPYGEIDFAEVQRLAEEQSVVGLVAAGLEHVIDMKVQKKDALQFIGQTIQMEQKNLAMNLFIGELVDKMRKEGINTLLVKGQGIAQCYERPLWRSCGDVDFYLNDINYTQAKEFLSPLASSIKTEGKYKQEFSLTIDPWVVELHGNMRCGLSARMDKKLDEIQKSVFCEGDVRSWMNGGTKVFLPGVNCDICFVFTHFLKHFYCGGIGLRQICDWTRLLWSFRNNLDRIKLEHHLKEMGLVSEWKAFGAFAVGYLGMPSEAMPFFSVDGKWKRKAAVICSFVMEVGNFGYNRDSSYYEKYPFIIRKICSLGRRCGDILRHARVFPLDSLSFFPSIVSQGLKSALRGE